MRVYSLACATIVAMMLPAAALADDPRDPEMRNVAAREKDREGVRDLNSQEQDRVRERDAQFARNSRNGGGYGTGNADYAKRLREYEEAKAKYDRDMAEWRRATAQCQAGKRSACD